MGRLVFFYPHIFALYLVSLRKDKNAPYVFSKDPFEKDLPYFYPSYRALSKDY
ncbi:MAG: hypothetical protein PHD88_10135 [Firmicutes bacterium]|nr:hypothetical protein [Bacillota bacterium]